MPLRSDPWRPGRPTAHLDLWHARGVGEPWNINIHYDARLERLAPDTGVALDVGSADGFLCARLARRGLDVVAVDADRSVVQRARSRFPRDRVDWRVGDVFGLPLPRSSFDVVVSNATLHHLGDAAQALEHLGSFVKPGGRLGVVAFVRARPIDLPWQAVAWLARGIAFRVRGKWEHTAPQLWPPPDTLGDLRRAARDRLPGARVRRLWYGRAMLTWTRQPESVQRRPGQWDPH